MCLCEQNFNKKLIYGFLRDLQRAFDSAYGDRVNHAERPYEFIAFEPVLQKIKKSYSDTRSASNINRLNQELNEVTRIMTKNMQDIVGRGESLDKMSTFSKELSIQSKNYLSKTKKLNLKALYHKYGPMTIVILLVILVLIIKYKLY